MKPNLMNHEQSYYTLILNLKKYQICNNIRLSLINPQIYKIIKTEKQYHIKSNVTEKVFVMFIKYLIYCQIPKFEIDYVHEYDLLSQEFDFMNDLVQLFKKQKDKILYHQCQKDRLKKVIQSKIDLIEENKKKFKRIIYCFFFNKGIGSYIKLTHKFRLLDACEEGKDEYFDFYTRLKIRQGKIDYSINENEKTASIYRIKPSKKPIIVPKSIVYESIEYPIVSIQPNSFHSCDDDTQLIFPDDCEIRTIENEAFDQSDANFTIPKSVIELKEGWCIGAKIIKVNQYNKNFINFNDTFILGKSDSKIDFFDVLVFANRNVKHVEIDLQNRNSIEKFCY